MAVSQKVHVILTKYFMCINQRYNVIYLQSMKCIWLILWPGGAYTDDTYATTAAITIPYRGEIMNHDYIGSFWQCQMSQKSNQSQQKLQKIIAHRKKGTGIVATNLQETE